MALRTAEMRPEEERRGLTSQRSLAAGSAAWSEGNDGGGGVRGWRSIAHGVRLSYSAARCSGRGRGGWRGAGAVVCGSSAAAGMAGVKAVKWRRRKKRVLHGGGWLPL
jgi:hypothetical protein